MEKKLRSFNREQILELIKISNSYVELTNKIGLNPNVNSNKKRVERYIKELGISVEHFDSVKRLNDSKNRWNKEKLQNLVIKYNNYNDILIELGVLPVTTNYNKLKKCLINFEINFDKLKQNKQKLKDNNIITKFNIVNWDNEEYIKKIVSDSFTQKEVLQKLNIGIYGNNYLTLKKYIEIYNIDTSHFIKRHDNMIYLNKKNKKNLCDILVEKSTYSRTDLKKRLYNEGLKERKCELCGQGEEWNGHHMSLIIDHINGVNDDNRIENLRIVCPNCNATLDTHCGKNNSNRNLKLLENGHKIGDKVDFRKEFTSEQKIKRIENRKVKDRPSLEQLLIDTKELGYSGTGRKYGVSDNAVRKWIKNYKNGI